MITIREIIRSQLNQYSNELKNYKLVLKGYSDCQGITLYTDTRKNGRVYYSKGFMKNGKTTKEYIGPENDEVRRLKSRDYIESYVAYLESICETLANFNEDVDAIKPFMHSERGNNKTAEERAWLIKQEEYKRKYPPDLKDPQNRVTSDVSARTKAESICISLLEKYGITYMYECPLLANGNYRYPDFLLFINGKVFIWEHLGLFYSEDYYMKQFAKITDYASIGFYAGTNLFFTYDGPDNTTDAVALENTLISIIRIAYA